MISIDSMHSDSIEPDIESEIESDIESDLESAMDPTDHHPQVIPLFRPISCPPAPPSSPIPKRRVVRFDESMPIVIETYSKEEYGRDRSIDELDPRLTLFKIRQSKEYLSLVLNEVNEFKKYEMLRQRRKINDDDDD